jgi:hypothetical protein
MLGDAMYAANGIFNQIFAQTGHFDTLCVGSTCLTESQLDALLAKNGIQASNATSTDATTTTQPRRSAARVPPPRQPSPSTATTRPRSKSATATMILVRP